MTGAVKTTCPYCGVGCGVVAVVGADGVATIAGDADHPANFGRLCSKGSALDETLDLTGRLLHPDIGGTQVDWDTALDHVAATFRRTIAEHGPDSVALYVSGQLLTEDYYVANKLMKGFVGSANIDTNSRLCMASTVAGHKRAFGSDTVPGCYEDLEQADLVVLVGSNLAWCHPVLFQRLLAAKHARPGMRIVAIDPRRTVTADAADCHLALAPDSDVALFNGLLHYLIADRSLDRRYIVHHTNGFSEAAAAANGADLAATAAATGLSRESLLAFFAEFAATERTVTVFSQGVNQSASGTDKVNAIINVHLATGRIGRPGMGPFSVTGQPNAMGGREVGGLANQLAAHMDIDNPDHRALVRDFWNATAVAAKPGLRAVDMFEAVADGRIKALWIMATNPVDSLPDGRAVEAALKRCPFVVVSDVVTDTDTLRHAHVRLPAAAWGEKDGTVTNSERRISRQRAFLPLPGDARPDWWIVTEVARRMGWAESFPYASAADIYREHAALSAYGNEGRRDFDIGAHAALDDEAYDALAPVQWPLDRRGGPAAERLFVAGGFFTSDRRARFVAVAAPKAMADDPARPFILNTGRVRDHWHTMTRTAKSPRLSAHVAEPFAEIHPDDAARLGIGPAELVAVENDRGRIVVRAVITERQRPGSVFVPMHWTDQVAAQGRVGTLVAPVTDPHSGQPASKRVPVRVRRFAARWYGFAVTASRPQYIAADYWALARCRHGWCVEMAGLDMPGEPQAFAGSLLGTAAPEPGDLAYYDSASGEHRFARFQGSALSGAVFIGTQPVAVSRTWLATRLGADMAAQRDRICILAGRPRADLPDPGPTVCVCFEVGAAQIIAAAGDGCTTVEVLGARLGAGTGCGSCRVEIGALLRHAAVRRAG